MRHDMRILFAVSLILAIFPLSAKGQDKEDVKPGGEKGLEVRLIAKKDTFALDRQGKNAEDFAKFLQTFPDAPTMSLVVELRNKSDRDISVMLSGGDLARGELKLHLKGPGAMVVDGPI